MATAQRARIETDNEKYGDGFLDEDAPGGAWIVVSPYNTVTFVATNRQAAEDAIYAKAKRLRVEPQAFSIQVWHPEDAYPPAEED